MIIELIEESNGDTTADSENEAVGGGTEGSIQSIDTTPSAGAYIVLLQHLMYIICIFNEEFAMESTTGIVFGHI